MDKRFTVFLTGRLVPGRDEEQVKISLEKLFKIDRSKVDKLLATPQFVVKKDIDYQTSLKYQSALKSAGVFALIKPVDKPRTVKLKAIEDEQSATNTPIATTEKSVNLAPQTDDASSFELAPVGVDFREGEQHTNPPPAPDVSHLSLDKVGVVIHHQQQSEQVELPDISHLSMGKVGEQVADEVIHLPVVTPDTSHFQLTKVGEKLVDVKQKPTPESPDTSSLSLAEKGQRMATKNESVSQRNIDTSHLSLNK